MTAAGVDTWSPSWYLHPDGPAAVWMREHATVPGKLGDYLPEKIAGHRVGWFRSGLVFAEGHPDTIPLPGHLVAEQPELCPPGRAGRPNAGAPERVLFSSAASPGTPLAAGPVTVLLAAAVI